jgi:hypothetical protein
MLTNRRRRKYCVPRSVALTEKIGADRAFILPTRPEVAFHLRCTGPAIFHAVWIGFFDLSAVAEDDAKLMRLRRQY